MDEVTETDDGFVKADRMLQGLAMALLRLGVQLDINEVDESRWIYLVRQLYLVSALGGQHYVAVAGEQGAGKTLLMRNLYPDAEDWLEDNPGRGEKNPVAIVERSGLPEPQGIVITRQSGADAVRTGELTQTTLYTAAQRGDWQQKVRGEDPNVLMTVLEVPPGFWSLEGTGFVLLPGLERGKEQHWQQLMKIVLATSPAAVLVTDERRMANAAQKELLEEMRRGGDLRFVVAVSRCETSSDTVIAERVKRAVEVFEVHGDDVVAIGKDTSRPTGWVKKLQDRVDGIRLSATDSHRLETELLRGFVQTDLVQVLNAARQARDRRALDTSAADIVDELLGTFDQESESIRETLSSEVTKNYDSHMRDAKGRLRESLEDTGGWEEWWIRRRESVKLRKNERNERLAKLVEQAWWGPEGDKTDRTDGPNRAYLSSVQSVADTRWEVVGPAFTGSLSGGRLDQGVSLTLTGKTRKADPGQAVERRDALTAGQGPLVQAIRTLPVMALYARAFAIELAQPDGTISPVTETDLTSKINGLAAERKQLLAALGLLLGADLVADGDIDLLNNVINLGSVMFTGSAGAAAGAGAVATTALLTTIGVGVVAAVLLNAGNDTMAERDRLAHAHLGAYREVAERSVLENVDELLRLTRDILQARLQTALGTDDRLNAQFSLRSATQNVENIRARMLEALGNAELA